MKTFLFSLNLLLSAVSLEAQSITATGNWSLSGPLNTISAAGNDYNINLTSVINQTILDINVSPTSSNWRVNVNKQDSFWDNRLTFWIHKTGDGVGTLGSSISPIGSTVFQEVHNLEQLFFQGTKNALNIPVQYEIRGLSVLIPVSIYSTTIIYTIIEY